MVPNDITHLAFVAGFLEGDGSFPLSNGRYGQVVATQKDPEVLEKLVEFCGGNLTPYTSKTGQVYYNWRLSGTAGYELAEAIRPFMTSRRQRQIDKMLQGKGLRSYNIDPEQCPKGHVDFGIRATGHRYCRSCNRARANTYNERKRAIKE